MKTFAQFLADHPAYAATGALDELRAAEYGRLDAQKHAYLDYTGGGLHAASQIREHALLGARWCGCTVRPRRRDAAVPTR